MTGKKQSPQIKTLRLDQIQPAEYNPREIDNEALAGLAVSMKKFGCVEPIIINVRGGKNTIIGGHQRFRILQQQKAKRMQVVTVNLSAKNEKALNITLNNPAIQGRFIAELDKYLAKLRAEIGDTAYLDLQLSKLQEEIKNETKKFEFRPGEGYLQATGTAKSFFLKQRDMRKFDHYKTFILDFSGGKDSTLALAWIAKHFADKKIYAVFSETGVEFPGMGAHVEAVANFFNVEPVILKPQTDWWCWLVKQGQWPSMIFRQCQNEFIFKVTKNFRRKFPAETTLLLDGSRAKQAIRGSKKKIDSPVGSLPNYPAYHPCFNLIDEAAAELLKQINPPNWEGYCRGFVRTACWCCPGQCGLQAAALEDNYPGLTEDIRRWEKRIGLLRPMENKGFDKILAAGRKKQQQQKTKKAL